MNLEQNLESHSAPKKETELVNLRPGWLWLIHCFVVNYFTKRNLVKAAAFVRDRQMHIGIYQMVGATEYRALAQMAIGPEAMAEFIGKCQRSLDTHEAFFKKGNT